MTALTFDRVYEEHHAFVWRSLRRLGVPDGECCDAAQDVFVVVHRRLAEFEGRSKITTWLFGICIRVCARRRQAQRALSSSTPSEPLDVADENADVEAAVERNRGIALLESILGRMSIEQREVFILFELEGVGLAEIAELFKVPLGTVQSRLRLARHAFRSAVAHVELTEVSLFCLAESTP